MFENANNDVYQIIKSKIARINQGNLPGIIATVLSARKTRNVRRAARFPKSTPMVI